MFVTMRLANAGDTPATITSTSASLSLFRNGTWVAPGRNTEVTINLKKVVKSGEHYAFRIGGNDGVNRQAFAITPGGEPAPLLVASGVVSYLDANGVERETGFFRTYSLNIGQFVRDPTTGEEYED